MYRISCYTSHQGLPASSYTSHNITETVHWALFRIIRIHTNPSVTGRSCTPLPPYWRPFFEWTAIGGHSRPHTSPILVILLRAYALAILVLPVARCWSDSLYLARDRVRCIRRWVHPPLCRHRRRRGLGRRREIFEEIVTRTPCSALAAGWLR